MSLTDTHERKSTASTRSTLPQLPWGLVALLAGVSIMSGLAFTWPLLRFIELDAATAATLVLLGWGPWVIVAALIIVFARVTPLDPDRWRRTLPLHFAACATLALGSYLVADFMRESAMSRRNFEFRDFPRSHDSGTAAALQSTAQPSAGFPRMDRSPAFPWTNGFNAPKPDARMLATMMLSRSFGSGLIVPVYVLLLAVTQAMRNHRRADETARVVEKSAHQLAQARLRALQNQLQPHFLFNTLNAVTNYIHTKPHVAEEMLCSLSDMLRRVLSLSDRTEIPLREELELVELYLNVQRHRFADRLDLDQHIDQRLLACPVPPLLLQPIVENAIEHGVAHATTSGRIELRVEEVNQHLRITVIDHHPAPASVPASVKSGGVGLTNTRDRLATLYGDRARLHAKPRLEGGFLTELNLPLPAVPVSA